MVLLVVGVMIGFVLGLRFFNVFVLFPAFGLAVLGTAAVGIGRGERLGSVILTIVFVGSALQIGYLVGIVTRAVSASLHELNANVPLLMWVVSTISACSKVSRFKSTWKWWVQMVSMSARSTTRKVPT
jgi:hypothetical protein